MSSRISSDSPSFELTQPSRDGFPRLKARAAGALYLVAVFTAVFAEFFAPGKLGIAAILIPISCYVAVTLLLYGVLKPVRRSIALFAVVFGLVGLAFEGLQLQPHGVNIGMTCHGIYCLLIGYLIFRSSFMPRILGLSMAFAGLVWLIYLSAPLARFFSPYNSAVGLLAEALPMLWLLVLGVNAQRWNEQARVAMEEI